MTGGKAVILGETGRNFGAGMSGGIAYVYDVKNVFSGRCNKDMIDLDPLDQEDAAELQDLITKHHAYTNSTVAKFILKDWENQLRHFVKVFPKEYKAVINASKAAQKVEK
jgi:glutamate synthase (NADPH/NADH) large chain